MSWSSDVPVSHGTLPGRRTAVVLALWFLAIVIGNETRLLWPAPGGPPVGLLVAIAVPVTLFALAYRFAPAFRDFVLGLDLRFLTATMAWRVIGGSFIVLYAQGLIPGVFAYPAGLGDISVGAFAVFALMALLRATPGWQQRLFWLNVFGLIDFAAAVGTGVLAGDGPIGLLRGPVSMAAIETFPLNLIPTFAVPLWTLVHMAALLQLRALSAQDGATFRPAPA